MYIEDGQIAVWREVIGGGLPAPDSGVVKPLSTAAKVAALFDTDVDADNGASKVARGSKAAVDASDSEGPAQMATAQKPKRKKLVN